MEVAATRGAENRSLSGERAQRIITAMRDSVAEVGIQGSTFEKVAARAGVSRGLLHYYFGTKERLLVEVVRRDTEERVESLVSGLDEAQTVDELILAFIDTFRRTLTEERGYVYMVSELFVAGRSSTELTRELGELYHRSRTELAAVLRAKEREGVIKLRFDAEAIISHLIAAGDGAILQQLSDPTFNAMETAEASYGVARFLLSE
jgi:AcrR family transcriptional regulator